MPSSEPDATATSSTDLNQEESTGRLSSQESESVVEMELESTDHMAPLSANQLRDVIDSELQQLRDADITAPYYNPDWD